MSDFEGYARSVQTFGDHGPQLREHIPVWVANAHNDMAAAQLRTNSSANFTYGAIWHRVLQEFAEQAQLIFPDVTRLIRPATNANFSLVVFNGVALFPFRYASDLKGGQDKVPLSRKSSPTRLGILSGSVPALEPELDLWPDGASGELWTPGDSGAADELKRARQAVRWAADNVPKVVVVAFASNPMALHRIVWGEVELHPDWTMDIKGEDLTTTPAAPAGTAAQQRQQRVVGGAEVADRTAHPETSSNRRFDSGPVEETQVRPRSMPEDEPPAPA